MEGQEKQRRHESGIVGDTRNGNARGINDKYRMGDEVNQFFRGENKK